MKAWDRERSETAVAGDRQGAIERHGMRPVDVAREIDSDVANLQRREVCGVVMPGPVDQMNQGAAARRLIHDRHFDERMCIRPNLAPARQQLIDDISEKTAVCL